MKRLLTILLALFIFSGTVFAQDEGDFYDDGYIYEQNGAGDQYFKADLFANFPLSFGDKLFVGGGFTIGYYRFINSLIAIGGEVSPTYNVSIGIKSLIMVPITIGAVFVPTIDKFEFPIGISLGITTSTFDNNQSYFPSFTAKAYVGGFYRINESWSVGLSGYFLWTPQFIANEPEKDFHGLFATAGLSMRYHF